MTKELPTFYYSYTDLLLSLLLTLITILSQFFYYFG
jgi:hypothetical protein